jgi:hypothetical protein
VALSVGGNRQLLPLAAAAFLTLALASFALLQLVVSLGRQGAGR